MQIAIDGPAGAGKSTVAKLVASRLGYLYIDTGAMYRALTYLVLEAGVEPSSEEEVHRIQQQMDLRLVPAADALVSCRVFIGDTEITEAIRRPEVSQYVSIIASHPKVRSGMVRMQQQLAAANNVVMDGRDIGTTVLPDADVKVFLCASVEERARRRYNELVAKGHDLDFGKLVSDLKQRDHLDSTRAVSPLRKADDAVEIDTTDLTVAEVVEQVLKLAARREKSV
ncbi:MAG TPA: (d)CMP kinase [Firmicutes bacterium]|nr:(d)CMP kinase [Bacillota bacterium]